ncbi:MAG: DUF1987 domain-containing protein [Bacteroidota bacterium]
MNQKTIKNTVSLFLHYQKLIAKPKRIHYSDLKSLLNNVVDEPGFNNLVRSVFNLSDHYFVLEKYKHPTALLVDINVLAEKIKLDMNPNQKLIFITILFQTMKINKQEHNLNLERAIYCVAEIFSFKQKQTDGIKSLFFASAPAEQDYQDSVLLTNEFPDYNKVIDGFKVIYNPEFGFKIWIKNVKSVNNMLFKVLECNCADNVFGIKSGDILTLNRPIQSLLNQHRISMDDIAKKIISNASVLPRIKIPATEGTPSIVLNAAEKRIQIEGVSMCLQPQNFFSPVFYWLEKMKESGPPELTIHINLAFFNTYTSKVILNIFQKMQEFETYGCETKYYWYFEEGDDELKEAGEHYASIINREFVFVATATENLECA